MKIYYIFSKNDQIGSKLISWASGLLVKDLDKTPSHMAILIEFEKDEASLVLESVFQTGVRIVPYSKWLEINEQCYKIPCPTKRSLTEILSWINLYWGRKYDWSGVLYFALCFVAHLLFKTPFPNENAWQSEEKFFCNELGGKIAEYERYSMVTPAKMCSDFLKLYNKK